MKKVYLLGALSGLLLASCANDDLVVKPVAPTSDSQAAIAFQMKLGNMSRAPQALNEVMDNFGVWAFKANDDETLRGTNNIGSSLEVIPNYRVNYEKAEAYGSHWNYVTADWATPVADPTANPAADLQQFLKYWDGAYDHTYFFAYGPHWTDMTQGSTTPSSDFPKLSFAEDKDEATMEFPHFVTSAEPSKNFIYSEVQIENNAEHVADAAGNTVDNPKKVPLKFHRVFSQVKIAIYEEIPGYDIYMEDVVFAPDADNNVKTAGIVAIPADYTPDAATKWARGEYLNSGTPTVVYTSDAAEFDKITLTYAGADMGSDDLDFTRPTTQIGETKATATQSPSLFNVMPNYVDLTDPEQPANVAMADGKTWSQNSGLQFVMSYVLKSKDTSEEIHVKGARVYVTPEFTNWKANSVYTYIFKITKNTSGTTTDTPPTDDPDDPKNALYPIIFDQVEIANAENPEESEWLVNGVEFQETSKTLTEGDTYTIDYIYDGLKLDWSSSDENVATVADGVVTAKNAGRATITATTPNKATATCEITVVPTVGFALLSTDFNMTVGDDDVEMDYVTNGAKTLKWTSTNPDVATVVDGVVSAVAAGTAKIQLSDGTVGDAGVTTQEVTVTVSAPTPAAP